MNSEIFHKLGVPQITSGKYKKIEMPDISVSE